MQNVSKRSALRGPGRLLWWAALVVLAYFVYRQYLPSMDLSEDLGAAPDFTLQDVEGRPFTLSEHRGEVVVLNFWATWCPPCRAEIPGFIDLQDAFRDRGVLFVGVALDEEGAAVVRPYARERGMNYPVLVDGWPAAARYGGVGTVPTTFLIDAEGRIRYRHTGLLLQPSLRAALERLAGEASPASPAAQTVRSVASAHQSSTRAR